MAEQLKGACFAANGHEKRQTARSCICSESILPEKLQRLSSKEAKLHNVGSGCAYSLQSKDEGLQSTLPLSIHCPRRLLARRGPARETSRVPEERLCCGGSSFSLQEPIYYSGVRLGLRIFAILWTMGCGESSVSAGRGYREWLQWAHVTAPYGRV